MPIGSWISIFRRKSAVGGANPSIFSFNEVFSAVLFNIDNTLTGVPSGATLVIAVNGPLAAADGANTSVVNSSPSLSWTLQASSRGAFSGSIDIWTATFTAGGSVTVNSTWNSANAGIASGMWAMQNIETSPAGAVQGTSVKQTAPSVTMTSTKANSIIICCTDDWNAVDGSGRVYRDSAVEDGYHFESGISTSYYYHKVATTITSYTEGLTTPSSQSAGTCLIEMRGT